MWLLPLLLSTCEQLQGLTVPAGLVRTRRTLSPLPRTSIPSTTPTPRPGTTGLEPVLGSWLLPSTLSHKISHECTWEVQGAAHRTQLGVARGPPQRQGI